VLGEGKFDPPVAAAQAPAPVVALRMGDGTWFGGSQMFGPGKLTAYSAKLTDSGPVFARVAVRYTYDNAIRWTSGAGDRGRQHRADGDPRR